MVQKNGDDALGRDTSFVIPSCYRKQKEMESIST
jgi:hypothetical protein